MSCTDSTPGGATGPSRPLTSAPSARPGTLGGARSRSDHRKSTRARGSRWPLLAIVCAVRSETDQDKVTHLRSQGMGRGAGYGGSCKL